MKILLAEDTLDLSNALVTILKHHGYTVKAVYNGEDALEQGTTEYYDCIILDIMMPKMDGISVLNKLRQVGVSTPVLMLTAKSELNDKIIGLDSGADDYLTKPFQMPELLARLRSIIRRQEIVTTNTLQYGNITLKRESFELSGEKASVHLSSLEFGIIEMLFQNPNKVINSQQFISRMSTKDDVINETLIVLYISYLQKKLSALQANFIIKVENNSYRLESLL